MGDQLSIFRNIIEESVVVVFPEPLRRLRRRLRPRSARGPPSPPPAAGDHGQLRLRGGASPRVRDIPAKAAKGPVRQEEEGAYHHHRSDDDVHIIKQQQASALPAAEAHSGENQSTF